MKLDLKTRLGQLSELSDGDLSAFNADIIEALAGLPEGADSAAAIGQLHALQSAGETVRREFGRRETVALAAETVTASGAASGTVRRMAARQGPRSVSPEAAQQRAAQSRTALTATGALDGFQFGQEITDRYELADAMTRTLSRMDRRGPARGTVLVASAKTEYPEERRLGRDAYANSRKMEAVTSPAALVASGGICLPVNVDYTVPTWSSAERPLRDGLPAFEASRGGLRYITPPDISALAGATGIWTEAIDANPGAATKPIISVSCATEQLVYVEAVATRLGFGNMQSRFAPEQIAASVDLAMAAAARIAENNLLNLIAATCVQDVTSATLLGATRDLMTVVSQSCAGYRSLHRLSDSAVLTAIFPTWVRDLIRVDLARETAHQQDSSWNSLAISNQQIDDMLAAHGVNPIWHLDGQPVNGSVYPSQQFAAQAASSAINPFPAKLVWYLFAEGSIQFLDGGRLDLGVVRDSTLDATNDWESFIETFEGIANRGFANSALQLVSTLCANGGSAGTISTSGQCA